MSGSSEASGGFEVPTPILNKPFDSPPEDCDLREGEPPHRVRGRRPAAGEFGRWNHTLARNVREFSQPLDSLAERTRAPPCGRILHPSSPKCTAMSAHTMLPAKATNTRIERMRTGNMLPAISASTYGPARHAKAISAPK